MRYDVTTHLDMGRGLQPVGPPTPQEWKFEPRPPGQRVPDRPGETRAARREQVTVSAVTFECMVVDTGTTSAWIPATGETATFPGIVRVLTEGKKTLELVAIE